MYKNEELYLAETTGIHICRQHGMFCHVLHYTGCRPSEALELSPGRILMEESAIVFRSLKKRKQDSKGRQKHPQYCTVPVPNILIQHLDLVFGIRVSQKRGKGLNVPLWSMSRPTAYRLPNS
jgi:integrase/recombinase XerD